MESYLGLAHWQFVTQLGRYLLAVSQKTAKHLATSMIIGMTILVGCFAMDREVFVASPPSSLSPSVFH